MAGEPGAIDGSVYPDREPPDELVTLADRADYVQRICGAWDYGIEPYESTFTMLAGWRDVFEAFPLPHSPSYYRFLRRYGWPVVTENGSDDPASEKVSPC